jgi:WD40 repeat protein
VAFLEGHSGWIYTLSFDAGSRLVSGSQDTTIKIWECAVDTPSTPPLRSSLEGHTSAVRAVAWSPNSSVIVSGSEDHTLIVWEAKTRGQPVCLATVHTNTFLYIVSLSWIPDGSGVVTTCGDNSVRIWRALAHECVCDSVLTKETD